MHTISYVGIVLYSVPPSPMPVNLWLLSQHAAVGDIYIFAIQSSVYFIDEKSDNRLIDWWNSFRNWEVIGTFGDMNVPYTSRCKYGPRFFKSTPPFLNISGVQC
jgi:hypothetical protein